MEINRFDPERSVYVQVADWLRGQIEDGTIGPGEAIPSKKALRARFGISGQTVDRAVQILKDEGLVHTAWELGIFVIPEQDPPAGLSCRHRSIRRPIARMWPIARSAASDRPRTW